jgi:hypothetical protein
LTPYIIIAYIRISENHARLLAQKMEGEKEESVVVFIGKKTKKAKVKKEISPSFGCLNFAPKFLFGSAGFCSGN